MFEAKTIDDLCACLLGSNVEVPSRSKGRTKDHVEVYATARLLGSLPWGESDFPLRLDKSERPDFILHCDKRKIGVEHTEAISQNAAKEAALRAKGEGSEFHFLRRASLDELKKSSKALIAEIAVGASGSVWGGDSVEREWAEAMMHFVMEKLSTAKRPGFQLFEANWLLIYDNWTAPALDREKGLGFLRALLLATAPWEIFERIFILDERLLLEVSVNSAVFHRVNHCLSENT